MRMLSTVAGLAFIASPALAASTTYDAFASFSATPRATRPFTYGSFDIPTGSFTPFAAGGTCNTPDVVCQSASSLPEVLKSTNGSFHYSTAYVPADALDIHPGSNPDESNSVAIMFTAPKAGTYTFAGTATVADIMPSGANLYRYVDGIVTHLGELSSMATSFTADPVVTMARGARVGLIVGNDGDYRYDTTAVNLSATIAGVPETGTWTMMIAGIAMVGVASRRRRLALAV